VSAKRKVVQIVSSACAVGDTEGTSAAEGAMKPVVDITVAGRMGLFTIDPHTPRARRWFERHLTVGERTPSAAGGILCEGTGRCMDIVAAADRGRLRVEVNGQDMRGFGKQRRRSS
jgi:hypothetical protein